MSDFKISNAITKKSEGFFCNVPGDSGKMTYVGISRKNFPNWKGWKIVDKHLPLKNNQRIIDPILDELVDGFYIITFWNKIIGDHIDSQRIANLCYDWYVNAGTPAIKHLCLLIGLDANHINLDIVKKINAADEDDLFNKYKQSRIQFYEDLVKRKPALSKFLSGWLKRVDQFK